MVSTMLDYDIIALITAIATTFLTIPLYIVYDKKMKKKPFRLVKHLDIGQVTDVIIPPTISKKYDELNIKNIQLLYRKQVKKFLETLEKIVPKEYLQNFYNNINEIKFKPSFVKHLTIASAAGGYAPEINVIEFKAEEFFRVINHELLHMASATHFPQPNPDSEQNYLSGFVQFSDMGEIGRGFNEGYTVHLDHKYFSHQKHEPKGYKILGGIAKLFESIVGEQDMMKFYFTANLNGLYNLLCNYIPGNNIYQFLTDCDFIYSYGYGQNLIHPDFVARMKSIISFLITLAYSKLCITNDSEKENKIATFVNMIFNSISYDEIKQPIINAEEIKEAIITGEMFAEQMKSQTL